MRLNKRLMIALLAVMMTASFTGCSGEEKAGDPNNKTQAASTAAEEDDAVTVQEADGTDAEEDAAQADAHDYRVYYYEDVNSEDASEQVTVALYGTATKLMTLEELGISADDEIFEGWRLYREMDNKWYVRSPKGKIGWRELEGGELPDGYVFQLKRNGGYLTKPAAEGDVRLYAQWGGDEFTVLYHEDEDSKPSDIVTTIKYGETTQMYYVSELGFEKDDQEFDGWKLYREVDDKWYVRNADGKGTWVSLENGKLPDGYKYYICKDGRKLTKAATSGIVHAYAQWK